MLQKFREKLHNAQRGAIMVFFALLVPLFLGMIGFAVDAGFLYMQKAKLQDIADAAALAGAGHLGDSDDVKAGNVKSAVRAYAQANGLKVNATDMVELTDANYDNLGTNESLKIAQGIDKNVLDKDNVERDHVRVVISRKVPTFFIRMLFPDQKEVVVRALAAAEYVEGSEPVVSGDGPVIISGTLEQDYSSNENIVLNKGQNFSIYAWSDVDVGKLPGKGTIYSTNIKYNGQSVSAVGLDKEKLQPIWNPPMEDRNFIPVNGWFPYYEWGKDVEYHESVNKEREEMNKKVSELKNDAQTEADNILKDIDMYISGNEGNLRYIGFDKNGNFVNNIRDNDTEIELIMTGTDTTNDGIRKDHCWLTNRQLKNVTKIKKLVTTYHTIIATEDKIFGDIYLLGNHENSLGGKDNYFQGRVYANSTESWFGLGGINNHIVGSSMGMILCSQTLKLGKWRQISEEDGFIPNNFPEVDASGDSGWKIHFGLGSSSGSSSDSDNTTNAHVRLVI